MYNPLYEDTDSVKCVTELTPSQRKEFMKLFLNSVYGIMVTEYLEENKNMNKNYIVVHDVNNGIGIVFKDKIGGVFKDTEDGTAKLLVVDGYTLGTFDKYEDIVKQII